ncbi:MAG: nuclear transport factor 2 family protein [Burkholderiales bacterium]|nr:nuclear transport factor 2 family protein [Burkholderiales bacterium]
MGHADHAPAVPHARKGRSTRDVVDNHLKCFGERDLEGILADYAPGAIFFTPQGPLRGRDQIGALLRSLLAEFGNPGASFSLDHLSVDGDYAYLLWKGRTADNAYELCTDTFVVRDGTIAVQSFAAKITPLR